MVRRTTLAGASLLAVGAALLAYGYANPVCTARGCTDPGGFRLTVGLAVGWYDGCNWCGPLLVPALAGELSVLVGLGVAAVPSLRS